MSSIVEKWLKYVVDAMDDKKAIDLEVLNVKGISGVADYFVIAHGNSERQVQAIVSGIKDAMHQNDGMIKRVEGYDAGRWVLVDCGDIVVHVFHREERGYYNLERLWSDAPRMERV